MVKHGTAIEATTITLDAIATFTITNVYQLKTMLYLHVLQSTSALDSSCGCAKGTYILTSAFKPFTIMPHHLELSHQVPIQAT